jgi:environmental stress-induced protein Ves
MRGKVLTHQAYPVHPWRNGGGTLRHIADGDGWQLRLADITRSGPFSDFSGYLRLFAMVEGAVVLQMPGGERIECDPQSAVTIFDGGAAPQCSLVDGPAKAFNLIVQADKVDASLERLTIGEFDTEAVGVRGEFMAIHVQSGQVECRWRRPGTGAQGPGGHASNMGGRPVLAAAKDTLMPLAEAGVLLRAVPGSATAVVLVARIRPLAG